MSNMCLQDQESSSANHKPEMNDINAGRDSLILQGNNIKSKRMLYLPNSTVLFLLTTNFNTPCQTLSKESYPLSL